MQSSKALLMCFVMLNVLAVISVALLTIQVWVKILCVLLVIYIAAKIIKQYVLLKAEHSISKMNCANNLKCRLEFVNGKVCQAKLISADWLFDYFAILEFQKNAKKFKAVIAKDAVSQEQFYALRLYLRSLN